jgi:hypothetical protein
MAKYVVRAYKVIQTYIEVEAEDQETAREIGFDQIQDGIGNESEPVWQSEVDVELFFD